jgi:hypothetical protein
VQFPGADIRCVGFANPRVGSQAFCKPDLLNDIFTVLPVQARCGQQCSFPEQMCAAWALPALVWATRPSASRPTTSLAPPSVWSMVMTPSQAFPAEACESLCSLFYLQRNSSIVLQAL